MSRRKIKTGLWLLVAIFAVLNIIAYNHAYRFTHFGLPNLPRTKAPEQLSFGEKLELLFTGIDNPKPSNKAAPSQNYKEIHIQSTYRLHGWTIKQPSAKGTVILFHGYAGEKSSLISRSDEFIKLGYNTLLIDFMGSGMSAGDATTIGYREAEQVKACYDLISASGEKNIHLFGSSMGAASVLKAICDYGLQPKSVILECPFGSLYKTVAARFRMMGIPEFPMAGLLTFWGGVQHGFWGFSHNPSTYAEEINCPALLLYGARDERVTREETETIFDNLKGFKSLKIYENAGHNVFSETNRSAWIVDVQTFLRAVEDGR
jgi:uncharacterized protein